MKNLLVPTDFSAESHHAFDVALQLARRLGSRVTLLHVVEVPETATVSGAVGGIELPDRDEGMDDAWMPQLLKETRRRMHELVSEASRTSPTVSVRDLVLTARTDSAILQTIEEQHIDLVVVGAQIHTETEVLFEGSHTEQLVRLAPCPVLTVKYAVADFAPRRILFASDFTAEADQAVRGLRQVQALFPDAELHLLQVIEDEAQRAAVQAQITAFAQRHGLQHPRPAVFIDSSPSEGIPRYARQVQANLLVVPTHGRTGRHRFLHTSIAESVATHAFPPVLTFKLA
ncbi:universal stress protein [Hymenobacter elongatus]|uniref:Universal stress protein n=1 Tax=Hymenobacter elongatus TaxID=877208 RepID=A0A4Z0PN23_9BACT|nr:universal stress protein [Hymenobacter elongatus]TGE17374.1 universal stress protein [Hymenobacter elongatus]